MGSQRVGHDLATEQQQQRNKKISSLRHHDQGTRESDGKIVGLAFQSFAGVMIYRTDIAEEVFGTSDPDKISDICGGNSGSLTKLLAAGDKLVENGYALTSGLNDMWFIYDAQEPSSWYKNGDVYISDEHESFFDFADTLYANNYTNKNAIGV